MSVTHSLIYSVASAMASMLPQPLFLAVPLKVIFSIGESVVKQSIAEAQSSEGEENWVSSLTVDHQ